MEAKRFWQEQPLLPERLEWVYGAFWTLSNSRPTSMGGVGSIPFQAADRYAERFEVDDFNEFWVLIRALDDVFVREMRRRSERARS